VIAEVAPARIRAVPAIEDHTWGDQAVELAAEAGLELDPWQADVLRVSLGQRVDGLWAAFEVGVEVPRQNGKGGILEARELASLFLLPERMIVHSAHQFDTSLEAFRRLLWLLEDNPRFEDEIRRVSKSHGDEGVELVDGSRVRFRTRTKGGGRGFSADCLILDEAMFLPEYGYGALLPILSAMPNPQVWYTGSAVDQDVHPDGTVFARVRERGIKGDDPRLAYFEWSLPYERPEDVPDDVFADEVSWAQTNPALGIRITAEHVANERRALDARTFAVERLGVGDWPDPSGMGGVLNLETWAALEDQNSRPEDAVCFAFDVAPDRSSGAIARAGRRSDGLVHVEVVKHDRGTGWIIEELERLVEKHGPDVLVCDGAGPAASLMAKLDDRGVEYEAVNAQEHARACGMLFDTVEQSGLKHLAQAELTAAIKGAAKRPLGDAWAWARKSSASDISPLVAVTLALYGVELGRTSVYASRGVAAI
jgi:hypothetical protein